MRFKLAYILFSTRGLTTHSTRRPQLAPHQYSLASAGLNIIVGRRVNLSVRPMPASDVRDDA